MSMSKVITYKFVKESFEKEKYTLLSNQYISAKSKLNYICPNGHEHSIAWSNWNHPRKYRCPTCARRIVTYTQIKQAFEKEGYTLLSTEYKSARTKLNYVCPEKHQHCTPWNTFQQGKRCPSCAGNIKILIENIKIAFEKENYVLLTENYINNSSKLDYICSNRHKNRITWQKFDQGHRCPTCAILKSSGEGHPNWKGGVVSKNLPLYSTYAPQLEKYQSVYKIEQNDLELLGVHCTYCKEIFVPTARESRGRIEAISRKCGKENNLYCSKICKNLCPTYKKQKYQEGQNPNKNLRPLQNQWAAMVKERDNYTCVNCGARNKVMYAHHIDPVVNNPVESADIDNGVTLCKKCHKNSHQTVGCSYSELRC